MPKKVIFHIGLPKTGTSSVQHYLSNQDEQLRSLGVLYPGQRDHPMMDAHKHMLILRAMLGKAQPSKNMTKQSVRDAIGSVFTEFRRSDFDKLIWSSEGIAARGCDLDGDYVRTLLHGLDVRVVIFARYLDDWVESLYKERIRTQGGRARSRATETQNTNPLLPLASGAHAARSRKEKSALQLCSEILGSLQAMRKIFPTSEFMVRSYDIGRANGTVVSDALAAFGLPVASAFPHADDQAGVQNSTKSTLYSMLIYNLVMGQADPKVVRAVTTATKVRDRENLHFSPLSSRRFRFLTEEQIAEARGYYEELRQEYPDLPVQPPHTPDPAERSLPKDDGVALLGWLRPNISEQDFRHACAAYTPIAA